MNKFNKMTKFFLMLSVAGFANVATCDTLTDNIKGAYLGIGAGIISLDNQVTGAGTISINDMVSSSTTNDVEGGNYGFNGDLFAGYSWTFTNNLFLAGEIFGNLTNVPVPAVDNTTLETDAVGNSSYDTTTINMTLKGDYGIRLLPGYQVKPGVAIYGIVGYSRAKMDVSTSHSLSATTSTDTTSTYPLSSTDNYWFNGLQLGLGSMMKVTEHLAIRGDIIWTGYQTQTISGNSTSTSTGSSDGSIEAQPTTVEGDVSLVYMFD